MLANPLKIAIKRSGGTPQQRYPKSLKSTQARR